MPSFGELVLARRRELKLKQVELARKSGVSQPVISQYENGDRGNPSHATVMKLETVLGPLRGEVDLHPSLKQFLDSPLGQSLNITAEERVGLNRVWFDEDEEPTDQAWYEFLQARRLLRKRQ
jgi:transcriptional regulator with XRE-family HTH domain